jgi:hypothetical protein
MLIYLIVLEHQINRTDPVIHVERSLVILVKEVRYSSAEIGILLFCSDNCCKITLTTNVGK